MCFGQKIISHEYSLLSLIFKGFYSEIGFTDFTVRYRTVCVNLEHHTKNNKITSKPTTGTKICLQKGL